MGVSVNRTCCRNISRLYAADIGFGLAVNLEGCRPARKAGLNICGLRLCNTEDALRVTGSTGAAGHQLHCCTEMLTGVREPPKVKKLRSCRCAGAPSRLT